MISALKVTSLVVLTTEFQVTRPCWFQGHPVLLVEPIDPGCGRFTSSEFVARVITFLPVFIDGFVPGNDGTFSLSPHAAAVAIKSQNFIFSSG